MTELMIEEIEKYKKDLQRWKEVGCQRSIEILNILKDANIQFFDIFHISVKSLRETKITNTVFTLSRLDQSDSDEQEKQLIQVAKDITKIFKIKVQQDKEKQQQSQNSQNDEQNNENQQVNKQESMDIEKSIKQQEKSPKSSKSQEKTKKLDQDEKKSSQKSSQEEKKPLSQKSNTIEKEQSQQSLKLERVESCEPLTLPEFQNKFRNMGIKKLHEFMLQAKNKSYSDEIFNETIMQFAINLESEVWNKNEFLLKDESKTENAYKTDLRQISSALKNDQIGKEIVSSLIQKQLTIQQVASCKSEFLSSNEQRKQMLNEIHSKISSDNTKYFENLIKKGRQKVEGDVCKKCKKKFAYVIRELQTRSSDEPMTSFYQCFNCNAEWKE